MSMNQSKEDPHYIILKNLYELWQSSMHDEKMQQSIKWIAWELGVELGFDNGYFELSELASIDIEKDASAEKHYREVIETNLHRLGKK